MSIDHVLQFITDHMTPTDLAEKLEPYITTEEMMGYLEDFIGEHYTEIFADELEKYYGES
jgi:hypothetical protein